MMTSLRSVPAKYFKLDRVFTFALLLLIGTCALSFPMRATGVSLDDSWEKALAHFAEKHLQAGTDYIFTYGPLGYLDDAVYQRGLFWQSYVLQILTRLLLIYYLARMVVPHSHQEDEEKIDGKHKAFSLSARFVCLVLLLLYIPAVHPDARSLFFLALLAIHLNSSSTSNLKRFVDVAVLSAFSLNKFTFFIFSFVVVFFSELQLRRLNRRSWFSPVIAFSLLLCLAWVLVGQSLSGLPRFLYASVQIAVGYTQAMSISGSQFLLVLSILILFLLALLMIEILWSFSEDPARATKLLVMGSALLLAWKGGFVRQDNHMTIFYGFGLFAVFILILHFDSQKIKPLRRIFRLGIAVLAICGCMLGVFGTTSGKPVGMYGFPTLALSMYGVVRGNFHCLLHPSRVMTWLEFQEKKSEKEASLQTVRARVKDATIDLLSFQQAFLVLNKMNWMQRPVFQSYSAYTPYLARRNEEFFQKTPPQFLLYKLQTLDEKFPTLDDNLAFLEILLRYVPVATERSFILFQKNVQDPPVLKEKTVQSEVIPLNREVMIEPASGYLTVFLDIKKTFYGALRELFYKSPVISIRILTSSGKHFTYKLIPSLAREGFLLSPLLQKTDDVAQLFGSDSGTAVKSFTVVTESPGSFQKDIRMEVKQLPEFHLSKMDSDKLTILRDSLELETSYDCNDRTLLLNMTGGQKIENRYRALFGNGSLETAALNVPAGKYHIVVLGYGTKAGNIFPAVTVCWNGKKISDFVLGPKGKYEFPLLVKVTSEGKISLTFTNDAVIDHEDRNVFVRDIYLLAKH